MDLDEKLLIIQAETASVLRLLLADRIVEKKIDTREAEAIENEMRQILEMSYDLEKRRQND